MSNPKLSLISIGCGALICFLCINYFFSADRQFENFALGTQTIPYQASHHDTFIHLQVLNEWQEWQLLSNTENKDVILFLGNSQTHSINQKKDEEVNYIQLLDNKFGNDSIAIRCHSLPNAGLQEFYLAYEYWKDKMHISHLVVPLFMDDLREDGVRDVYFPKLVSSKYQVDDTGVKERATPNRINQALREYWVTNENNKSNSGEEEVVTEKETFQEISERYLTNKLDSNSQVWRNRPNVRGEFFLWLYQLRNTVFQIDASTVRKLIPHRYKTNMETLEELILDCRDNGCKVILYIPPIRHDVQLPYDNLEYRTFKSDVQLLADKYPNTVEFENYETIVPGKLWGYKETTNLLKDKEVDYMHFQYKGHQILADSLSKVVTQFLNKPENKQ